MKRTVVFALIALLLAGCLSTPKNEFLGIYPKRIQLAPASTVAMQNVPAMQLYTQDRVSEPISRLLWLPDGKRFLSGGGDWGHNRGELVLWDMALDKQIRDYSHLGLGYITGLASKNGKTLVTSFSRVVELDYDTGIASDWLVPGDDNMMIEGLVGSKCPDKLLLKLGSKSGDYTRFLNVIDTRTRERIFKLERRDLKAADISADGSRLFVASNGMVEVFDLAQEKCICKVEASATIKFLAISNDGRFFAVNRKLGNRYFIKDDRGIDLHSADGTLLGTIDCGANNTVACFSTDGETLYTVSADTLEAWSVADRTKKISLRADALAKDRDDRADPVISIFPGPGPEGLTVVNGKKIVSFETGTSRIVFQHIPFEIKNFNYAQGYLSETGLPWGSKYVCLPIMASRIIEINGLLLYNLESGRGERTIAYSANSSIDAYCIDSYGRRIALAKWSQKSGVNYYQIEVYDAANGALVKKISGHKELSNRINRLVFGKDPDTLIFIGNTNNRGDIYSTNGRLVVGTLNLADETVSTIYRGGGGLNIIRKVRLDAANRYLYVNSENSNDQLLYIIDLETGKPVGKHRTYRIADYSITSDGKACAILQRSSSIETNSLVILEHDGRRVSSINIPIEGDAILKLSWLKDRSSILLVSKSDQVYEIRLDNQESIRPLGTFPARITDLMAVNGGDRVIYLMDQNKVGVQNSASGELITIVAGLGLERNLEWISYTGDGYWDGSINAGRLVAMVRYGEAWNIDQFAARNNRPDIIAESLGAKSEMIDELRSAWQKRIKRMNIDPAALVGEFDIPVAIIDSVSQDQKYAELKLKFTAQSKPLTSYQVYVNDVPLFGAYGKPLSSKAASVVEQIELGAGQNKIEVSCMDAGGAESYRATTTLGWYGKPRPDLYFLAFGVSNYADPQINDLQFAADDARSLEEMYKAMAGTAFNRVYTRVLTDGQVTKEAVSASREFLESARVDDTFVLFIAGHGVYMIDATNEGTSAHPDTGPTGKSEYYYITADALISDIPGTTVAFETVENLLQGIAPRNKLFLMDTCMSGEADDTTQVQKLAQGVRGLATRSLSSESQRGLHVAGKAPAPVSLLSQRDRYIYNDLLRRSGAIVFSSSRGSESSLEHPDWKHGAFTYAILKAHRDPAADLNKDGTIGSDELRAYVIAEVPRLVERVQSDIPAEKRLGQHPTVDRDNIYATFGFPVLKQGS